MEKKVKRLCINPNDIATVTGKSVRHARNVYNDIRVFYKKKKHQSVSIREFSEYIDIPMEEIERVIAS
jgi:hypothetical protein